MNLEQKIIKLEDSVFKEANSSKQKILEECVCMKTEALRQKELESLTEAYAFIQKKKAEAQNKKNAEVLKSTVETRKELILFRDKIVNDVFDELKKRFLSFKQSDEYAEYLKRLASKAFSQLGEGEYTIAILEDDDKYTSQLRQIFGENTVFEFAEEEMLGGLIAKNKTKRLVADLSVQAWIEEQTDEFLKQSGLSIAD